MLRRLISLVVTGLFVFSNTVTTLADAQYYHVVGNSMKGTYNDGDIVKVESSDYRDGDVVVAELHNGQLVIKRLQGDRLVGDNNDNSQNYKLSEVKQIIGKADQAVLEEPEGKALQQVFAAADIDLQENPIIDVAATRETAIFLHQDTSLSGIGSNITNVLGMTGGITNNTGDWVRISGPTGISRLVAGANYVFGLIEEEDDPTKYNIVRLDNNIADASKRWKSSFQVKDLAMMGSADSNPHQSTTLVDADGILRIRGSDYSQYLGLGVYWPSGHYPGGSTFVIDQNGASWDRVLKPGGQKIIYPESGSGWFASNDNSTENVVRVTPAFTVDDNIFSVDINWYNMADHPTLDRKRYSTETSVKIDIFDGHLTDEQILSGIYSPVFTSSMNAPSYERVNKNLVVNSNIIPGNSYKLKVTSSHTGWQLRIRERKFLDNNIVRVVQAWSRNYSAITSEGRVIVGNGSEPKELNLPADVRIVPESAVASSSSTQMAVLDTNNNLWLWTTPNNASQAAMPAENGKAFKDAYEILDIALGNGFQMIKTRNKANEEINVWVWGSNAYGKLGMGEAGTVIKSLKDTGEVDENGMPIVEEVETVIGESITTPTKVMRPDGTVLNNIQAIAAGQHFSVIVQNTDEGQLVWTSGLNNSGQLGGGVNLVRTEPMLVTGVSGISRIQPVLSELLMFNDNEKKIYKAGDGLSYVREVQIHPNLSYYPAYFSVAEYRINTPMYTHAVFIGEDGVGNYTIPYRSGTYYGTKPLYTLTIDEGIRYRADGSTEFLDFKPLNNGSQELTNIKKAVPYLWGTMILDSQGRIWSAIDNSWTGANYVSGQGGAYSSAKEFNPQGYPGRAIGRGEKFRPARVDFDTLEDTKFIDIATTTKIKTTNVKSVAISENRDLYQLGMYSERWNLPAVNGKADKLFSLWHSVALLTTDNQVYVWGNNGNYRLGTGNNSSYSTPQNIPKSYFSDEEIIDITANDYATFFLTGTGKVYVSGTNNYSIFGDSQLPDATVYSRPTLLENLSTLGLKSIKAGEKFIAGLDNKGRGWVWGYAAEGSLGDNFTSNRSFLSTAVGNDLPQMSILDGISARYYSSNSIYNDGRSIKLSLSINEPDFEVTKVYADMFGQRKTEIITNYEKDIFDKPVPQDKTLEWQVSEIPQSTAVQTLTKIVAEDERGGIIEQFLASPYIIDDELPEVPQWEDVYRMDTTPVKIEPDASNKYISQDKPIGITTQLTQKAGHNRAPVYIQYQYRQRQAWGYPQWSDPSDPNNWITVESNKMEFFTGFTGEHEIRIRAIDAAGNVSAMNTETKRIVIGDAGPSIENIKIEPYSDRGSLYNEITFDAISNSSTVEYTIERESEYEQRGVVATGSLAVTNNTVKDTDGLKGNLEYTYYIKGKNQVGYGTYKSKTVTTYPYPPIDVVTRSNEEQNGLIVTVKQDRNNYGSITYRLVLEEISTSNIYQKDLTTTNVLQDAIYNVKNMDAGFELINNPMSIKILYKGVNPEWNIINVDSEALISPTATGGDIEAPRISSFRINNGMTSMYAIGDNKVKLQVRALDNITEVSRIQVRFSLDGYSWKGLDSTGRWADEVWGSYKTEYNDFPLGELAAGLRSESKVVYVAARDESGNIGYGYAEITLLSTEYVLLDPPAAVDTSGNVKNTWDQETITNTNISFDEGTGTGTSFIFLNAEQAQVKLSDYFDINAMKIGDKEVPRLLLQYSFDGITWSEWEPKQHFQAKEVTLPIGDGLKTIHIRGKDPESDTIGMSLSRKFILDTQGPVINIRSANSTYIAVNGSIKLEVELKDNMVTSVPFKIETNRFVNGSYVKIAEAQGASKGRRIVPVTLNGLPEGQIKVMVTAEDGAGNFTIVDKIIWSKNTEQ